MTTPVRADAYPVDAIHEEFAALGRRVYLDICARSPLPASAVRKITTYLDTCMTEGARKEEWLAHIESVRGAMARFLNATNEEIAYLKATTEGVNAFAQGLRLGAGDNVIVCPDVEHPSNLYPWLNLRERGVEVRVAKSLDGQITPTEVARLADGKTRVVAVPHVSFKTGARADLKGLSDVAHRSGALLFVDAAQSVGLLEIDVRAEGIDAMAACVHKGLLAPYGLGILFCRRELVTELQPIYMGRAGVAVDDEREYVVGDLNDVRLVESARKFEFGSYNFPAIYALGASLELLAAWDMGAIEHHVLSMSGALATKAARAGFDVASPRGRASSHIVCLRRDDADALAAKLDGREVRVSARLGILRAASGPYTTEADLETFMRTLAELV